MTSFNAKEIEIKQLQSAKS